MPHSLKVAKEARYLYGVLERKNKMSRRGELVLRVFVCVMAFWVVFSLAVGVIYSVQAAKALRLEQEQSEIAQERCLVAGYPEFRTINHHFYCVRTVDGTQEVKRMVLE